MKLSPFSYYKLRYSRISTAWLGTRSIRIIPSFFARPAQPSGLARSLALRSRLMRVVLSSGGLSINATANKLSFESDLLIFSGSTNSPSYLNLLSEKGVADFVREGLPDLLPPGEHTDRQIVHGFYEEYQTIEVKHVVFGKLYDVFRSDFNGSSNTTKC